MIEGYSRLSLIDADETGPKGKINHIKEFYTTIAKLLFLLNETHVSFHHVLLDSH